MASLNTLTTTTGILPNAGNARVMVDTGTQTQTGGTDTFTVVLANYGINALKSVNGFVHTTDGSVITTDAGTTSVTTGTLTVTIGSGNNNKRRVYYIEGV